MDSCKLIDKNRPTHSGRNSKLVFGLCVCVFAYVGLLDGQKTALSRGSLPGCRSTFGYREIVSDVSVITSIDLYNHQGVPSNIDIAD